MKKITFILGLLLIVGCSSDDNASSENETPNPNPEPTPIETIANYFPLVVDNEWNLSNTTENQSGTSSSNETLNVNEETLLENIPKFQLTSTSDETNFSFTSILSSGLVYKENAKMFLTGNLNFDLEEEGNLPDFGIDFEDLVVYDENAVPGSILFDLDEEITLPEFNNITISATIQIQSKSLGSIETLEVNGVTYENVINSSIIVKIGVSASAIIPPLPIPITIGILDNQEVVVITNFFANQVGLIKSDTTLNVEFNDLGELFPIDLEDIFVHVNQELASYNVQIETE